MKIAFDVDVLAKQMDINTMVHQVADWGYKYIEQSPHPRINPFYKHPLFSEDCEREYRKALKETGVEISSLIVYLQNPFRVVFQKYLQNLHRLLPLLNADE